MTGSFQSVGTQQWCPYITKKPTFDITMPHSLVLNILPQSPIPPQFLTGRHLHALFLTLVSAVDSNLGEYLHNQTNDKAFTLSPWQIAGHRRFEHGIYSLEWEHQQPIPAGTSCWWRISLLDDSLFSQLTQLWLNLNPQHPWHLGPADLQITRIWATPQPAQPWANFATYETLYEMASETERQIAFNFTTPATFRQGESDMALPTREAVFHSLIHRWNKYSGIEFSHDLSEKIFPSFFNIRTAVVSNYKSKLIGCIGQISYRILGDADTLTIKQINALADFAMYAGVGRKTPMGMGMVRRVDPNQKTSKQSGQNYA